MVAELDGRHGPTGADRVQGVVLRMGAVRVENETTDDGRHLVSAEFHHVGDSTRAAVEVVRLLTAKTGPHRPDAPVSGLRMALCTRAHTAHGTPSGGCPLPGATRLVEWAESGRVLATEATVIVTGGGVPPGVDLVDRGSRRLDPGRRPERIYELRIGVDHPDDRPGRDGPGGDGGAAVAGRSNLEWARRAVGGVEETTHDLEGVLDELTLAWRAAQGAGRRTVLLTSHGTECKTRVAAELALRLHAEGALVLYGRWDRDVTAPYQGVREAFGVYADGHPVEHLRADLEGWGDEVARFLPDVAARIGGTGGGDGPTHATPGDERGRLYEVVEAWAARLARRRPTLLVLDDVQWAEPTSLQLLDHLHHATDGIPLLIVAAAAADDRSGDGARSTPSVGDVIAHADKGEVDRVALDD